MFEKQITIPRKGSMIKGILGISKRKTFIEDEQSENTQIKSSDKKTLFDPEDLELDKVLGKLDQAVSIDFERSSMMNAVNP